MRRFTQFVLFLTGAFFLCGMGVLQHREEIGTLKDQAQAQKEIGQAAKENEAVFKKIEAAFIAKKIRPGVSSKQIQARYGLPAASSPEGDGTRWLYRSLKGRMLDKPWVFLYFDRNGALTRWECGHSPACSDSLS